MANRASGLIRGEMSTRPGSGGFQPASICGKQTFIQTRARHTGHLLVRPTRFGLREEGSPDPLTEVGTLIWPWVFRAMRVSQEYTSVVSPPRTWHSRNPQMEGQHSARLPW